MKQQHFDTLIMKTAEDFRRLKHLHGRVADYITNGKLYFVGNAEVVSLAEESGDDRICAIDEDTLLPFAEVHSCIKRQMEPVLQGRDLPRGITGWYYQQFLKWEYAKHCNDEYYLVWDGDTIPCRPLSMFRKEDGKPYFDLKYEYHEPYFKTLETILPGMSRVIGRSFISEHMLINREICLQLIKDIESNEDLPGRYFWEKIIHAIPANMIQNSAFSEFETYGTYVALKKSSAYMLRDWHSFRLGGEFFDPLTISDRDFSWLAKDFDAISFEKGMSVREDHKNLFDNPDYQEKLSPAQMLQIAQEEFQEGYKEVWGAPSGEQPNSTTKPFDNETVIDYKKEKLRYLSEDTYLLYEKLGDNLMEKNTDQAFLCYENAAFLCETSEDEKTRLRKKAQHLKEGGHVNVKPVAIIILSYNNQYLMRCCLESIRSHCNTEACGVMVLDNASSDGVTDWLKKQDDISLLLSDENLGFPAGNNTAHETIHEDYDIMLLNNDTRMTPNALFWLRMGLYESPRVGATGCLSNYSDRCQTKDVTFSFPEQYVAYGAEINVPIPHPYEERSILGGFAILIRRDVLNEIGLFDEAFSPGYYEDTDLCLRIRKAGYRLNICCNSFIYHAGSQSFIKRTDLNDMIDRNRKYIISKWGFDSLLHLAFSEAEQRQISKIERTATDDFRVLQIGSGCGSGLGKLKYLFPEALVIGIEKEEKAAALSIDGCVTLVLDWKTERLPFAHGFFDYILVNDREGKETDAALASSRLECYLRKDGVLLL
ncbi:MAG: glycosyltransferase family 2 protein [Lachnospiraceae bacterium]|nr:glycosyltransferase family 2 protein [Lachnospiraceae bacterium]